MSLTSTIGLGKTVPLQDPTCPPKFINQNPLPTDQKLNIQAIFLGEKYQHVIINGQFFKIGDKLADATIIAITSNGITLEEEDGSQYQLTTSIPLVKTIKINPTTSDHVEP